MRKVTILFLLIILASVVHAQDLTGLWKGSRDNALLYIVKHNGKYIGYTYDEGMGFCECNFIGEFDTLSQKLKGRNEGFIRKSGPHTQGIYNLRYSTRGDLEQLTGYWAPKSVGGRIMSLGVPNPMSYYKDSKITSDTTEFMAAYIAEHMEEEVAEMVPAETKAGVPVTDPVVPKQKVEEIVTVPAEEPLKEILVAKQTRSNDIISTFPITSKTITIQLIDNGVVDGDTVSVIHNGKVVADRVAVTAKAHSVTIDVDEKTAVQEITLIAHNLGTIPPNTALVLIEAGEKKFRLNASADLQHNAVIIFKKGN